MPLRAYARSTGKPGVCMATSGPGATNLVTAIADAKLDSIPLVAITGQVPTKVIGTDAFQETPIVEVCRGITKHHYLVTDVKDLARVMKEAFHHRHDGPAGAGARRYAEEHAAGQDGARLRAEPDLPGFHNDKPRAKPEQIKQIAAAIKLAKRPIIYAGGGIISGDASEELRKFAKKTGHSGHDDRDGPGCFPGRRSAVAGHARHARQRVCQLGRRAGATC